MKRKYLIVAASVVLILSIMACSLGKQTGTPTAKPTVEQQVIPTAAKPPADALEILPTSSLTDDYGGFHVYGEVMNNSDTTLTSIELIIELLDANGQSLVKDEDGNPKQEDIFYPMLYTIGAGESSPFSYYFDTANGMPATYSVTVGTYDVAQSNRADLVYENIHTADDGMGTFYLSGELVNQSDQWVHINGLAGGVLDTEGTVLSAEWTGTYTTLLAPAGNPAGRERTPFAVSFPSPKTTPDQWSIWWDAEVATDVNDYDLQVTVTNSYFDEYDGLHLVGWVTNNTSTLLTSLVVAGLYDADGACLDADYSYLPTGIAPGQSVPFDISYFSNVNYNPDEAALVNTYTVQVDPWNTYEPYYSTASILVESESIEQDGNYWTVTGNFTNTTERNVSSVAVITSVYDSQGTLVGTNYTYVFPDGDFFAPGDASTYELWLSLDPNADKTGYSTETILVADLAE